MEDVQIVELYWIRDERAIQETDKKYGKLCFRISNGILNCTSDAEECVNDTYLGVWNSIPPMRPQNFLAYLCKIVRNLSLKRYDYNRAEKRDGSRTLSLSELEDAFPDNSFASDVGDEELGALISRFLRTLKPEARNVFVRRYWMMEPLADIARHFGFSESKVKSMLFHTRNKLKAFLEKEGITV